MKILAGPIAQLLLSLTTTFAEDTAFTKWEKEIGAIEAKIKSGESQQGSILFVGSSSIRLWNLKEWFRWITDGRQRAIL